MFPFMGSTCAKLFFEIIFLIKKVIQIFPLTMVKFTIENLKTPHHFNFHFFQFNFSHLKLKNFILKL